MWVPTGNRERIRSGGKEQLYGGGSGACYGTDTVPSSQYFISTFSLLPHTCPAPGFSGCTSLVQIFSCPLPNQPADDDIEMTGPTIEGEITYSSEVEAPLIISYTPLIILLSLLMKTIASPFSSFLANGMK